MARVEQGAIDVLALRPWPGNVRQLYAVLAERRQRDISGFRDLASASLKVTRNAQGSGGFGHHMAFRDVDGDGVGDLLVSDDGNRGCCGAVHADPARAPGLHQAERPRLLRDLRHLVGEQGPSLGRIDEPFAVVVRARERASMPRVVEYRDPHMTHTNLDQLGPTVRYINVLTVWEWFRTHPRVGPL